jgi:hypothetical protein
LGGQIIKITYFRKKFETFGGTFASHPYKWVCPCVHLKSSSFQAIVVCSKV